MRTQRGITDHRNWPRVCVGHMEREEGRLQLRYVIALGEGMCDIEVEETDDAVTVYGFICAGENEDPVDLTETIECPYHVYLDRPLGGRRVVDGHLGRDVPYKNVWAEMEAEERSTTRSRRTRG
jgi:hypothetical protein